MWEGLVLLYRNFFLKRLSNIRHKVHDKFYMYCTSHTFAGRKPVQFCVKGCRIKMYPPDDELCVTTIPPNEQLQLDLMVTAIQCCPHTHTHTKHEIKIWILLTVQNNFQKKSKEKCRIKMYPPDDELCVTTIPPNELTLLYIWLFLCTLGVFLSLCHSEATYLSKEQIGLLWRSRNKNSNYLFAIKGWLFVYFSFVVVVFVVVCFCVCEVWVHRMAEFSRHFLNLDSNVIWQLAGNRGTGSLYLFTIWCR